MRGTAEARQRQSSATWAVMCVRRGDGFTGHWLGWFAAAGSAGGVVALSYVRMQSFIRSCFALFNGKK